MRRALVLLVVLSFLGGCDLFDETSTPPEDGVPSVEDRSPVPGGPPLVWVGGTLQEIDEGHLTVRDPSEAIVRLQRLSEGATRFLAEESGSWRTLTADEASALEVGEAVCVEVLLDGSNLVALRVFLGASCGPTGAP